MPLTIGFGFSDPGGAEATSDYAATINWGDGSLSTATITQVGSLNQFLALGTHTYPTGGTFSMVEDINHEGILTVDTGSVVIAGSTTAAPEPASLLLLGTGLVGVGMAHRWRARRQCG